MKRLSKENFVIAIANDNNINPYKDESFTNLQDRTRMKRFTEGRANQVRIVLQSGKEVPYMLNHISRNDTVMLTAKELRCKRLKTLVEIENELGIQLKSLKSNYSGIRDTEVRFQYKNFYTEF